MKQVLHIFYKDVRHLWAPIAVVIALIIANAIFETRTLPLNIPEMARRSSTSLMLMLLLPVALAFLTASGVFQEALPGDRQFWLTRPYSWPKLLSAKLLFFVIFVNLPLFFSDCYILGARGFAVIAVLPKLLLRQVFLSALFILPSFALAAITSTFAQFLLAWFILLLSFICETMITASLLRSNSFVAIESSWVITLAIILTTCGIVVWQYSRRRTSPARVVLLIVACGYLPVSFGLSRLIHSSPVLRDKGPSHARIPVQISYDLARGAPVSYSQRNDSRSRGRAHSNPGNWSAVKHTSTRRSTRSHRGCRKAVAAAWIVYDWIRRKKRVCLLADY